MLLVFSCVSATLPYPPKPIPKLNVASSNLVSRSIQGPDFGAFFLSAQPLLTSDGPVTRPEPPLAAEVEQAIAKERIPRVYLTRLVENGALEQVDRGIYALASAENASELSGVAAAAKRVPKGAICLLSALQESGTDDAGDLSNAIMAAARFLAPPLAAAAAVQTVGHVAGRGALSAVAQLAPD